MMNHSKNDQSPTESFSSLYGHPAATRASLVQTANEMASAQSPTAAPRQGSLLLSDPLSQIPVSESPLMKFQLKIHLFFTMRRAICVHLFFMWLATHWAM